MLKNFPASVPIFFLIFIFEENCVFLQKIYADKKTFLNFVLVDSPSYKAAKLTYMNLLFAGLRLENGRFILQFSYEVDNLTKRARSMKWKKYSPFRQAGFEQN